MAQDVSKRSHRSDEDDRNCRNDKDAHEEFIHDRKQQMNHNDVRGYYPGHARNIRKYMLHDRASEWITCARSGCRELARNTFVFRGSLRQVSELPLSLFATERNIASVWRSSPRESVERI